MGDIELFGDFASGHAVWLMAHEKAKNLQPGGLGQGGKGGNCCFQVHMSRRMDIYKTFVTVVLELQSVLWKADALVR